ncbi:hypothetical protein IB262_21205 [Ensifer sp. ENS02]|uniref:hypothetical protein n=1 Tax=Ensifer sp. ENS02 TaxID=2769290 RepID=UPI00177B4F7F|nr:hypothetical protein [Ensifer sp. ENS02]MBD9522417.1 hypothetical protein [Ensifer sp. ENS02]
MTPTEMMRIFDGTATTTRASLLIDGNVLLFEDLWQTDDYDEFRVRLERFATALGLTARKRFYAEPSDELAMRIAADVRVVAERIAWLWVTDRAEPKGSA